MYFYSIFCFVFIWIVVKKIQEPKEIFNLDSTRSGSGFRIIILCILLIWHFRWFARERPRTGSLRACWLFEGGLWQPQGRAVMEVSSGLMCPAPRWDQPICTPFWFSGPIWHRARPLTNHHSCLRAAPQYTKRRSCSPSFLTNTHRLLIRIFQPPPQPPLTLSSSPHPFMLNPS